MIFVDMHLFDLFVFKKYQRNCGIPVENSACQYSSKDAEFRFYQKRKSVSFRHGGTSELLTIEDIVEEPGEHLKLMREIDRKEAS
jgi:hypothetical protein